MGWAQQLPDGRWRAFESEGGGGVRIRASATSATRTEARKLAMARLATKYRQASLEPHTLTLAAYLSRWFGHLRAGHAAAHTVETYESIARRHIPRKLAATKLADLRPLPLQQALNRRLADGAAPASVRKQHKMLHAALTQAVSWRLILANPCDDVTPPPARRGEMTALDEAQTAELLSGLGDPFWRVVTLLAVTTGMRRGELLALGWQHVDLDAAEIRVRRVVEEATGKPRLREHPKTGHSRRTITLMTAAVAALRDHRRLQAQTRLADGAAWRDAGLVFPAAHGRLWRPSSFSRQWGELGAVLITRQRIGKHLRLHDLRHTHATQLLRSGVPVDAVSKRLGHASATITLGTYAHVLDDADSAAVGRLEDGLGRRLAADLGTS